MRTAHEVLIALARRYAFREVAALVGEGADAAGPATGDAASELARSGSEGAGSAMARGSSERANFGRDASEGAGSGRRGTGRAGSAGDGAGLRPLAVAHVQRLCAFGQQLMDMDAEDFGVADATVGANLETGVAQVVGGEGVPGELVARALACRMPQAADERQRGALGSLRPAYRLLLEGLAVRWRRREMAALVAGIHITSQYAPLLVWEQVLGHAGDPARLPADVAGPDSAWGNFDDHDCRHTAPLRSAAQRALRVDRDAPVGWRSYLDRQHSNTARALAICAAECPRPCSVFTRLSPADADVVARGSRLALSYAESPIVRLRHAAPVGHGFGVPAPREVLDAWARTRRSLERQAGEAAVADDGFPLPGLASFVGTLAGVPMPPDTLLAETAAAVVAALSPARAGNGSNSTPIGGPR